MHYIPLINQDGIIIYKFSSNSLGWLTSQPNLFKIRWYFYSQPLTAHILHIRMHIFLELYMKLHFECIATVVETYFRQTLILRIFHKQTLTNIQVPISSIWKCYARQIEHVCIVNWFCFSTWKISRAKKKKKKTLRKEINEN